MELISREEAIEAIENICNTPCNQYFINAVKRIPTIEEREEGMWIGHLWYIECPNCRVWLLKDYTPHRTYCPNCGTRMKGEKNGNIHTYYG